MKCMHQIMNTTVATSCPSALHGHDAATEYSRQSPVTVSIAHMLQTFGVIAQCTEVNGKHCQKAVQNGSGATFGCGCNVHTYTELG